MSSSARIVSSNGVFGSGPVHEINVDVIGIEIAQIWSSEAMIRARLLSRRLGRLRISHADFGDDADIAPARAQSACESLLGNPHAIGLSGIETVDARVESAVLPRDRTCAASIGP